MSFQKQTPTLNEENIAGPQFENVKSSTLTIDIVILEHLRLCSYYATTCYSTMQKMVFINAVNTLKSLCCYYWLADQENRIKLEQLDKDLEKIRETCEPGQNSIETGKTMDNEPLIDIALEIARKKFEILTILVVKGTKQFETTDIMQ